MLKEQVNSGDARSRCKTGEERLGKNAVPPVDQMKQAARCAQDLPALFAAVFMRAGRTDKAVHRGERIAFAPELQAGLQGGSLRAEEEHEPPQCRAVQCPLVDLLLVRRRDVADRPAARRYGSLIRQPVLFQIVTRQGEQAGAGVPPVGQQESRADR